VRCRLHNVTDYPLTGRCLCGGVRFEVSTPPIVAGYCHCTRCQHRTGTAAAVSALVPAAALQVVAGAELIRCWQPPDGAAKCFCSTCGGHLWARLDDDSPRFVRLGAFDGDPGIRPSYRQFVAYAAPWEPIPDDGLTRFPERRPA
jgi:hypothetical protein